LQALLVCSTIGVTVTLRNTHARGHSAPAAVSTNALTGLRVAEFTLRTILLASACTFAALALTRVTRSATGTVRIVLTLPFGHPAGLRDALARLRTLRIGSTVDTATNRTPFGDITASFTNRVVPAGTGWQGVATAITPIAEGGHWAVRLALTVAATALIFTNAIEATLTRFAIAVLTAFRRICVLTDAGNADLIPLAVIIATAATIIGFAGTAPTLTALTRSAVRFTGALGNLDLAIPIPTDLVGSAIAITATCRRISCVGLTPRPGVSPGTGLNAGRIEADKAAGAICVPTAGRNTVFAAVTRNNDPCESKGEKRKFKLRPHDALLCRRRIKGGRD